MYAHISPCLTYPNPILIQVTAENKQLEQEYQELVKTIDAVNKNLHHLEGTAELSNEIMADVDENSPTKEADQVSTQASCWHDNDTNTN